VPDVYLPAGCNLVNDKGKYTAKEGDKVTVSDGVARQIAERTTAPGRTTTFYGAVHIGTRKGRRCLDCGFLGQVWSITCPRCEGDTKEES